MATDPDPEEEDSRLARSSTPGDPAKSVSSRSDPRSRAFGTSLDRADRRGLWLGGGLLCAGIGALAVFQLSTDAVAPLVAALAVAGVGWALAVRWAFAEAELPAAVGEGSGHAQRNAPRSSLSVAGLLLVALALRAAALTSDPHLSDDVSRYVWEGALVAQGDSPWAHAPSAPERAAERERWPELYAMLNNPDVSAAYPPVMQAFCAVVVTAAGGLDPPRFEGAQAAEQRLARVERAQRAMRIAFTLADLLVLVPLVSLLRRSGRSASLALTWAWCPLVVVAFAGTGHFDALGILFLVAALAARSVWGSALLLAAGTLVKFLPVLALPFLAVAWWRGADRDPRRRVLLGLGTFVFATALGMAAPLALVDGDQGLLRGLTAYATRWESFHLCFRFVEGAWAALASPEDSGRSARLFVAGLLAAFGLWRVVVSARGLRRDPEGDEPRGLVGAVYAVFAALFVLTPTLHPWYLTWLVPLLAVVQVPTRGFVSTRTAWLWLVAAAPLCYWPLERWRSQGVWHEPIWLWPLVALPFWALFVAAFCVRRDAPAR